MYIIETNDFGKDYISVLTERIKPMGKIYEMTYEEIMDKMLSRMDVYEVYEKAKEVLKKKIKTLIIRSNENNELILKLPYCTYKMQTGKIILTMRHAELSKAFSKSEQEFEEITSTISSWGKMIQSIYDELIHINLAINIETD